MPPVLRRRDIVGVASRVRPSGGARSGPESSYFLESGRQLVGRGSLQMRALQIISFLFFTVLVGVITWLITRKDDHKTGRGFFLAGRSLTFPLIAGSLLLTNLSTEQMVGLNGAAFTDGLCVMVWEVVAVVALVAMALYFLPRFLRSGIATVPQFLEVRFDHQTRVITNLIFLVAYAAILLPIILYTGARGLVGIMDLHGLTGVGSQLGLLYIVVFAIGAIGAVYALWGGLRTVAVSDTLNGIGLLVGGFMITVFAITAISGDRSLSQAWESMTQARPNTFNSIGGGGSSVPFGTVFTGILLLNLFYWCTNQQIIQRTFGAKSLAEGQKGVLLTGGLKLLGPMYLVLPGIFAFAMFAREGIKADGAYGMLVNRALPAPLVGFFAAALLGAILSSFNSALNSTCTLFSLGLYKNVLKPSATEEQVVRSGKVFGWIMAIVTMSAAPLLVYTTSIFAYLQKMNGMYFIPIFAVILVGMLAKRVPPLAAKIALVAGFTMIAFGYFIPLGTAAPAIVVKDAIVIENGEKAVFNVYLTKACAEEVNVKYRTFDGTAEAGKDYTAVEGALSFAPGATTRTVTVPLLAGAEEEKRETFFIVLADAPKSIAVRNDSYRTIESDAAAAGRIIDATDVTDDLREEVRGAEKDAAVAPTAGSKYLTDYIHEFHFLGIVFALLVGAMLVIAKVKPTETEWVQEDVKAVDMTPWKHTLKIGVALLVAVFLIYVVFADFSVFG
jgi:SSS family solute:Na+ symporter